MSVEPQRIQLKRTKGWRLQEASKALNGLDSVKVDRTTSWGNPFIVGKNGVRDRQHATKLFREWFLATGSSAGRENLKMAREHIKGKNLACWCPDEHCHATVLLELANSDLSWPELLATTANPTEERKL